MTAEIYIGRRERHWEPSITYLEGDRAKLSRDTPVIRLSQVKSALGALRIRGVRYAFVEFADNVVERVSEDHPISRDPEKGQEVVRWEKYDFVFELRKINQIRRILITLDPLRYSVMELNNSTIELSTRTEALVISHINNNLEIRAEYNVNGFNLLELFGFNLN